MTTNQQNVNKLISMGYSEDQVRSALEQVEGRLSGALLLLRS